MKYLISKKNNNKMYYNISSIHIFLEGRQDTKIIH
jgi:hypothetical protein